MIKRLPNFIRSALGVNMKYCAYGIDPAIEARFGFGDIEHGEPIFPRSD